MGTTIRQLYESAQELVRWLEWERESLEAFHAYGQKYLKAGCNVYLGVLEDALLYRGAMAAQDERERKAAERLGMVWNCDWPDAVADEVERLRSSLGQIATIKSCDLSGIWLSETGVAFSGDDAEFIRELHRKHCPSCLARAALEAK